MDINGPYAIVDILLAPHEDVLFPNDASHIVVADWPTTVRWTLNRSYGWDGVLPYDPSNELMVDVVDIEVATDGGTSGVWTTVATGVPNTGEYAWTPDPSLVGTNTVLRLTFHNTLSSEVGQDESDVPFTIVASPAARAENKSNETGLAYQGMPYSSVTLDADNDGDQDLMITNQTAASNMYENKVVLGGVPQFESYLSTEWESGAEPQVALHGLAVADYDNDGDMDVFAAANTNPRLYRNDGSGSFDDVAPETGVASLTDFSWCGSWQDYDGDGYLDLYVGRGLTNGTDPSDGGVAELPDVLLRGVANDQQVVSSFADVTTTAAIGGPGLDDFTASVSWSDFDGDGDADLAVSRWTREVPTELGPGDPPPAVIVYKNDGDGTFTESTFSVLNDQLQLNSSLTWVDIDSDGDMDLVGTTHSGQLPGGWILVQDGGQFTDQRTTIGVELVGGFKDMRVLDIDLDGGMDLIAIPESSVDPPAVYMRATSAPVFAMFDGSAAIGLETAETSGIAVEDWNGDGDLDIYLGRRADVTEKKFFYRNTQASGADAPTNKWAGVELVGGGGNNVSGIGATVVLKKNGVPSQVTVVDGGSGRGGQGLSNPSSVNPHKPSRRPRW